jgi:hypothetical protein
MAGAGVVAAVIYGTACKDQESVLQGVATTRQALATTGFPTTTGVILDRKDGSGVVDVKCCFTVDRDWVDVPVVPPTIRRAAANIHLLTSLFLELEQWRFRLLVRCLRL